MTNLQIPESQSSTTQSQIPLDDWKEIINAYWTEWEYRHKGIWSFYYKSIFTLAFVMAIPFIAKDYFSGKLQFGSLEPFRADYILFIFPIMALMITHYSHKVLKSEYARFGAVNAGYREIFQKIIDKWGLYDRYNHHFKDDEKTHFFDLMLASLKVGVLISIVEALFLFIKT